MYPHHPSSHCRHVAYTINHHHHICTCFMPLLGSPTPEAPIKPKPDDVTAAASPASNTDDQPKPDPTKPKPTAAVKPNIGKLSGFRCDVTHAQTHCCCCRCCCCCFFHSCFYRSTKWRHVSHTRARTCYDGFRITIAAFALVLKIKYLSQTWSW